jgi:hypothetical protein
MRVRAKGAICLLRSNRACNAFVLPRMLSNHEHDYAVLADLKVDKV